MIKNNIYVEKLRYFENSIFDVGDSGVCWLQPILSMCIKREDWFFRIIAKLQVFQKNSSIKKFFIKAVIHYLFSIVFKIHLF